LRGPKILTGGIARLFITADEGREITLFHIVDSQLCLISAICSIQKLPYTFNLEFLSDSLTYYLPAEYYQQLSQENLAVAKMNQQILEKRLLEMIISLSQTAFMPLPKRLACKLSMYQELLHSRCLPLTHEMLAKDLGVSRETISRLLKEWEAQGILCLRRGQILILEEDMLKEF
jgi:CRP/FNR family transcriptional regulator